MFQIGVTYSFSFDMLFAGLDNAENPIDFIFQLLGNITYIFFLGLFIGTMSMAGHIASWFTF